MREGGRGDGVDVAQTMYTSHTGRERAENQDRHLDQAQDLMIFCADFALFQVHRWCTAIRFGKFKHAIRGEPLLALFCACAGTLGDNAEHVLPEPNHSHGSVPSL